MDRKYWEQKGRAYDAEIFDVYAEDRGGVVAGAIRRLVRRNDRVGDLGCGTGKALPLLAARARSVEAVDLSASCLAEARRACADWDNITYRRADLSRDRAAGRLDFVLSVNVLIMPEETVRRGILRTIARRLRAGGTLVLVVPSLESSFWVARCLHEWERHDGRTPAQARRTVAAMLGDRFGPALAEGVVPIDGVPTKHHLSAELEVVLEAAGFRIRRMEKVSYSWRTEFQDPPRWLGDPHPWDWMVVGEKAG